MSEPTGGQIKEFWERCRFRHFVETKYGRPLDMWEYPKPYGVKRNRSYLPPIDLNNLFKYEPLTAQGYHIETDTYKREVDGVMGQCSWVTIKKGGKVIATQTHRELEDALFWALWQVKEGSDG